MFKPAKIVWLLPLCIILYACPFESPVALDNKPTEPVDTSFFGYWYGIVKDGSDFFGIEALDIQKLSDSTYNIIRYGKVVKGDMILPDTSHFSGYTSKIGDNLYMNLETTIVEVIPQKKKAPEIKTTKIYYLATLKLNHDTLVVQTVTEGFAGMNPRFHKPEELKQYLASMADQNKNIYDDVYKLSYKKTERPQQQQPKPF
ncbi:MAG: hypothetical protein ACHQEB_05800 [Chitinophagales bacterium]